MDKLKYNITINSRYDLDKVINTRGIILRTVLDIQCTLYYITLHYIVDYNLLLDQRIS